MRKATLIKSGTAGAAALAAVLGLALPALADVQPQSSDAVTVGSDTVQYVADFAADGDFNADAGYNNANTSKRLFSFDATGDAGGRATYQLNSGTALAASVVLRAGSIPVTRPNGSGAGISTFLADTAHAVDFVRSSRLPTSTEQAGTASTGALHTFQIATDGLQIAYHTGSTHVGTEALTGDDLVKIYTGVYKKWSDVPGYNGTTPNNGIVPLIPQTGSGTRNDFTADLQNTYNGGTAIALASDVQTVQEHDPAGITTAQVASGTDVNGNPVTVDDQISPFSTGRYNMITTPIGSVYYNSATLPAVTLVPATAPSPTGNYFLTRHLYLIARDSDFASATGWQAGSPVNKIKALFGSSTSWFAKSSNAPLFAAAGVTQAWQDLGSTHS
jgi:ABC-type phosphate transport system substrate-binding protein